MTRLERTVERRSYVMPIKRASWSAIFGGAFVAVAVMTVLGTLGVAIGAMTIDPAQGDTPGLAAFGIGAGLWWVVSGLIALFAGGWTAGRLAGLRRKGEGMLHGVITWAFTTVASLVLMTTLVGALISGAMRIIGSAATVAGQSAQAVVGQVDADVPWQQVGQELQQVLRDADPAELQEIAMRFERVVTGDFTAEDEQALVNMLETRTDMSREQAQQRVTRWTQMLSQAAQQGQQLAEQATMTARQAAQASMQAVAGAAWWTFIYLLLTAGAAAAGGLIGAPKTRRDHEPREDEESAVTT